jgi:hypothetical protein
VVRDWVTAREAKPQRQVASPTDTFSEVLTAISIVGVVFIPNPLGADSNQIQPVDNLGGSGPSRLDRCGVQERYCEADWAGLPGLDQGNDAAGVRLGGR